MNWRRRAISCALAVAIAAGAGLWPASADAATYPNDPQYGRQWHLRRIGAPSAWRFTKGKGVTIAIVDTGVNRRHEDLAAVMSPLQYNARTNRNDGSDTCAYDPQSRRRVCHGTAVAGAAVAATNNRRGLAGTAPDARIMAVQVFQDGGAAAADVAEGVMWAADHGAKVINLSLGGLLPLSEMDMAILYATVRGALVVVAAGNSGLPFCADPAFNPATICVGASDPMDGVAVFSNYGLRLDVVAPGHLVWTTCNLGRFDYRGTYCPQVGTSIAAPIVSGIGALLMSMGANNVQAGLIIRQTAKDLGLPGYDLSYGFGRVDAAAAVNLCRQVC